jgi:hypothetical protein
VNLLNVNVQWAVESNHLSRGLNILTTLKLMICILYYFLVMQIFQLELADIKPDTSSLHLISESELRQGEVIGSGAFGTVFQVWTTAYLNNRSSMKYLYDEKKIFSVYMYWELTLLHCRIFTLYIYYHCFY